jgi:cell cycle sensor histidine kinase DivJ
VNRFKTSFGLAAFAAGLVHPTARRDRLTQARHRGFIASHVIGGCAALLVLPVYMAVYGPPGVAEGLAFAWFVSPITIAFFLSRTGRYEAAQLLSLANLTGLVSFGAAMTGGTASFLLPWFAVIPFEAALTLSRRTVAAAIALACFALAVLAAAQFAGLLPEPRMLFADPGSMELVGIFSAILYAGGLAVTTHRVQAESEEAVRFGERQYRLLAENATDMISCHSIDGGVTFVSQGAERLTGMPPEELINDGLLDCVHVMDRPAFLTAISRAAHSSEPTCVEFRLRGDRRLLPGLGRRNDAGPASWVEMRCRPVMLDDPESGRQVRGVVAVSRDISESKAYEQALEEARDDAEAASRAKGLFLANMSHELRTPLNAIIGFSELLGGDTGAELDAVHRREYAEIITGSGKRLLSMVSHVLDVSRLEAGSYEIEPERLDVAEIVETGCRAMRAEADRAAILIETVIDREVGEITGDQRALKRIVENLISNAIKFSRPGGQVRVALEGRGDEIAFTVADDGVGISEQDLERIGRPFMQADQSYSRRHEGAGLGLALVNGLVELHGGRLDILSEPGSGTSVMVRLPREGVSSAPLPAANIVELKRSA